MTKRIFIIPKLWKNRKNCHPCERSPRGLWSRLGLLRENLYLAMPFSPLNHKDPHRESLMFSCKNKGFLGKDDTQWISMVLWRRSFPKRSLILPLLLSGCMGVYDGGFECPPTRGVPCRSISDINDLINQGKLPEPHQEPSSCGETACALKEIPSSSDIPHMWWNPSFGADLPIPPSLSAKGSV